ncbi:hypothetical protein N7539_000119 [Penicillium diatomitis]|uniref:SRR1-like domain-containing protein n=1 Tax=Penicillium diatomitis TaxID=2819901 RepID=A0A9W9XL64_9EURO|nr:uncharacterized protein N7539_000119 [Penicillium diatomitis]KAJ5495003.1 hypothetical protein N7539_000119 [Penicillium diatomitis]
MPHTSRKKRPSTQTPQKRLQVVDDDGWTHVTSSNNVRRTLRGTQPQLQSHEQTLIEDIDGQEPTFTPAEAPGRLTLEGLQAQYREHRDRWKYSETWTRLQARLVERIADASYQIEDIKMDSERTEQGNASQTRHLHVDKVVCVGLGSPSGFLRGGWVDRRSVSMYQLAALESVSSQISQSLSEAIPIYAQDPVFNTLDTALLSSLGITVISHPAAFSLITPQTLLFCPGAEKKHLEQLLTFNPSMVFGGPLEDTNSETIQNFADKMSSICLMSFEVSEHAFWRTRLYYREQ